MLLMKMMAWMLNMNYEERRDDNMPDIVKKMLAYLPTGSEEVTALIAMYEHIELKNRDRIEDVLYLWTRQRNGGKSTKKKSETKVDKWLTAYKIIKKEEPTWKKGVICNEISLRFQGTPFKGNGEYIQSKLKGLI